MRSFLKMLVVLTLCAVAFFVWLIQPDRRQLHDIEETIKVTNFNEVPKLMERFGYKSQTLTYFALADRFSRGDGSTSFVLLNPDVHHVLRTLCPIECQVTTSEKPEEEVPLLDMYRRYKFHFVSTRAGKAEVIPDHSFWIMILP
jgi:hypothetical protein